MPASDVTANAILHSRIVAATSSSHACSSPSREPKWCTISPALTPASAAIARKLTEKPDLPNLSIAAVRIRPAVVDESGIVERMFNIERVFNLVVNGIRDR
ncbi:hypothetical protein GCM10027344_17270 [Spelaeicoccus albus]